MKASRIAPLHIQAAQVVRTLASVIFAWETNGTSGEPSPDADLTHWWNLRGIADRIDSARSSVLNREDKEKLIGAFRAAHKYAHDGEAPAPERCDCAVGKMAQEFALLQVCEATGVHIPGVAA